MNKINKKKYLILSMVSLVIVLSIYKYKKIQAYNNLITSADMYMSKGDYDKAEELFKESLKYKKDSRVYADIQSAENKKKFKTIYDNGIKLLNNKKFLEAVGQFKKISKDCGTLFDEAGNKIKECKNKYIAQNIQLAKESFRSKNYNKANEYIAKILKLDDNNKEALNLKSNIQETIKMEKKAEEVPKTLYFKEKEINNVNNLSNNISFSHLTLEFINNKMKFGYGDEHNPNGIEGFLYRILDNKWKGYIYSVRDNAITQISLIILNDRVKFEETSGVYPTGSYDAEYFMKIGSEAYGTLENADKAYKMLEEGFRRYGKNQSEKYYGEMPRVSYEEFKK